MSEVKGGDHEGKLSSGCWAPAPLDPISYISWNCCGLGNPQTVDKLVTLVSKKDPKMVFLMETKANREVIERVCRKI